MVEKFYPVSRADERYRQTDRQTNRQADGQTETNDRQTDKRQTDRQTDRQTETNDRQTDRQTTNRQADRQTENERQTDALRQIRSIMPSLPSHALKIVQTSDP